VAKLRQPVEALKSLNNRQPHILLRFKEPKEPIQFELSYVDQQMPSDPEELYRSQVKRCGLRSAQRATPNWMAFSDLQIVDVNELRA